MNKNKWLLSLLCILFVSLSILLISCSGNGGDPNTEQPNIPHSHSYGAWQVQTPASCTEAGSEKRTCTDCAESEQRAISALGHNFQNGYCTRCGAVDPNDNTMIDGTDIKNVAVSGSGILSWSRLKIASKYSLTLTLSDGEHTYDIDKNNGSVNLLALNDGANLEYGKNNAKLTVYKYEEQKIDGQTVGGDFAVSTDSFLIDSKHTGYSLIRLIFEDEYVKLTGFYSDYFEAENGDEYLLLEKVLTNPPEKFDIRNNIKEKTGTWKIYKSAYDRDSATNAMEMFDFLFDEISLGNNRYYLSVANDSGYRDYDLVVRGVQYQPLTLTGVTRALNGEGDYIPTYNNYTPEPKKILQYDSFDINALYKMIPEGHIIRDRDFNIYNKDTDYAMPYGNLALYSSPKEETLEQIEEISKFKTIFNLTYNMSTNGGEDTWSVSYNRESDVKNIIVPARIIGNRINLFSASFTGSNIESVVFESGIKALPAELFKDCISLNSVAIPDTVTNFGDRMFQGVRQTLTIYCEGNPANGVWNQVIGQIGTYYNTLKNQLGASSTVTSDGYRIKVSDDGTAEVVGCINDGGAAIPNTVKFGFNEYTVTGIAAGALINKTSVELGANIKTIAGGAFGTKLQEISVSGGNTAFSAKDNILYNKDESQIILIPLAITGNITLSNNLTSLAAETFKNLTGITGITIPDSITSIGDSAFSGCTGIISVTIGNGVTAIGTSAFSGCTGLTSISIPDNITSVGASAFSGCTGVTSVAIGNGVTSLESSAFENCTALIQKEGGVTYVDNWIVSCDTNVTSVSLRNTTVAIANNAFYGCKNITNVTIPDSVRLICDSAFNGCSGLTSMTLPFVGGAKQSSASDKTFFGYIFGKTNYTGSISARYSADGTIFNSYYIPAKLTTVIIIGGEVLFSAFYNCTPLTNISVPAGITSIGEKAFYNCYYLKNIAIPDSVISIGNYAFSDCSSLTSVIIPESVTSIGNYAFSSCSNLTSITIPGNVALISSNAFYNCRKLTSVTLLNGITTIGKSAFKNCSSLTSVTMPESVTSIEDSAFGDCTNLASITIPGNVTTIDNYAFSGCSKLTSVALLNGITTIGSGAFSGCSSLTSITIPDSVATIGSESFSNCTGLTEMILPFVGASKSASEASETTLFGYIFGGSGEGVKVTQNYSSNKNATFYIPQNLKTVTIRGGEILYGAFSNWKGLTCVSLSGSIISIGDYAFSGCTGLENVNLSQNIAVIGDYAFSGCTGLKDIALPDSITTIDSGAFKGCTGFKSIILPYGITYIGGFAFSDCSNLTSINIPDSVSFLGNSAFSRCTGLTSISLPGSITSISDNTFYGCINLTSIIIPDSVTVIYFWAFYNCSGLTSIIIPNSVTRIDDRAFYNCSGLTSITIPDSVASIGGNAFSGCTGIIQIESGVSYVDIWIIDCETSVSSVTLRNNTIGIADNAFADCAGITSINIPNNVKVIGQSAFENCIGITSIIIPDSVTVINYGAFSDCEELKDVTIGRGVSIIHSRAFRGCYKLTSVTFLETNGWKITGHDDWEFTLTNPADNASQFLRNSDWEWVRR